MLSVSDNGNGIPADIIDKIIEPFFTTKGVGKGSGLGLSMVHGFVKQSGGHIDIFSEPGAGTTVKLYLPRSTEQPARFAKKARPVPIGASGVILVVEDDPNVRLMTVRMLNRMGYETLVAEDGNSGLQQLENAGHIDLLLTDIILPGGMSGLQIGTAARKGRPAINILFMSGFSDTSILDKSDTDEAGNFISKPFTADELGAKITEAMASESPDS